MCVVPRRHSLKHMVKHTWTALKVASVVHGSNGDRCRSLGHAPDCFQNSPGWGCCPRGLRAQNRGGLVVPPNIRTLTTY